jgi:hypothetical protein
MKHFYLQAVIIQTIKKSLILWVLMFSGYMGSGQTSTTITIPAGSFIINMGVTPQTVGNGLKPYGMIYDLVRFYGVPVKWVVNPDKGKDGLDFFYNGVEYRGGPFIIPAPFRTPAVDARIIHWQGQGVIGITTTSPFELHDSKIFKISSAPNWTLDKQNGSIAVGYFVNAGIPASAHGGNSSNNWKLPADLGGCDDIFVMPHADPKWLTHSNLIDWNRDHKGSIWNACHSPSALENMYDPANPSNQANFLCEKVSTPGVGIILPVAGSTSYSQNTLVLWGNHSDGTPPYSYSNHGDPIMQFMGTLDLATLNGSEQMYIPVQAAGAGWRPETVVAVYDPDHPQTPLSNNGTVEKFRATVLSYGRGFGDLKRGYVMHEVGHSHNKSTAPANIAAQRAFFNFSFFAAKEKAPDPEIDIVLSALYSGESTTLHFEINEQRNISEFAISWESSCGGSFSIASSPLGSATPASTTLFTAPIVSQTSNCVVTVTLTDDCGRVYKASTAVQILCDLRVTTTLINPCFGVEGGGAITMDITNGTGPFVWNWTRSEGGTGYGTGTTISGLSAGNYTVTVLANNGAGCPATFNVALSGSPEIVISALPVHISCPGGSNGSINASVSGGTPGFTYSWSDGPTTLNRSGLTAGSYTLTVTDSKGCSNEVTVQVNQPDPIVITPLISPVQCFDLNNGQINLSVTGGTGAYSYLWSDGNTSQNRTGLTPGTYSVVVTDANSCTQTLSGLEISQPAAELILSETHINILCFGGNNGSIDLNVTGGTEPYAYAWTKTGTPAFTASTQDLNVLTAGTYNVTVTDARGCAKILSVVITQPAALSLSITKEDPSCPPDAQQNGYDGTITLTVTGGIPFANPAPANYTYSWSYTGTGTFPSNQANSKDLTDVPAGMYTVVVNDANGCTATTTVTLVEQFPNPQAPAVINH